MKKDLLIIACILFLGVVLFKGTKIQSVDEYYLTHIDDVTADSEVVTLSITAKTVRDNWADLEPSLQDVKYIPLDGIILSEETYVLRPNDSVFDILSRATRHHKIQFDYQGSNDNSFGSAYIKGINYLYEFSAGPLSGWMYQVNGEFPDYGVSRYQLNDRDRIEIIYTCDLGRDIGGDIDAQIKK